MHSSSDQTSGNRKRRWNNLQTICRRPALWLFLFMVFLLLYCWPFLPTSSGWTGRQRYHFLIIVWACNIIVTTIVALSLPPFRSGGRRRD